MVYKRAPHPRKLSTLDIEVVDARKEGAMLTGQIFIQLIIILLAVQVFGYLGQRQRIIDKYITSTYAHS